MENETQVGKAERTKQYILEQAVHVFNQKGYAGTSLSDIMNATGLTKGCIYGHFESKEAIALEAFDYAMKLLGEGIDKAVYVKQNAVDRLMALMGFYRRYVYNPPIKGGCVILNTSIEADDTQPMLKQKVVKALDSIRAFMINIIREGKQKNEIRPEVNAAEYATVFWAMIEGSIMIAKAYGSITYLNVVLDKIEKIIKNELAMPQQEVS